VARGAPHQVDRAAHVNVDKVCVDVVVEELHTPGNAVRVPPTDLHAEDVLAGVPLQQRPLRLLPLSTTRGVSAAAAAAACRLQPWVAPQGSRHV